MIKNTFLLKFEILSMFIIDQSTTALSVIQPFKEQMQRKIYNPKSDNNSGTWIVQMLFWDILTYIFIFIAITTSNYQKGYCQILFLLYLVAYGLYYLQHSVPNTCHQLPY